MKYITQQRMHRFKNVANGRVNGLRVLLFNIYNEHNISAIIRTCDFFGIQYIDIINDRYSTLQINQFITKKVEKWMSIVNWPDTKDYIQYCKKEDYRIFSTLLSNRSVDYRKCDYHGKCTFVFGNEKEGITDDLLIENSDTIIQIPGSGFSQSLNVSVSAGIIISRVITKRKKSENKIGKEPKKELLKKWLEI